MAFKGKNALLTGLGKRSIGVEVIKGLLTAEERALAALNDKLQK